MKHFIRGEKVKLSDYTPNSQLEVSVQITSGFEIDITCFGLDANKQLTDDRYMIFIISLSPRLQKYA